MSISLIDTHAHLQSEEFDPDREAVLARAKESGISKILIVGSSNGWISAERALSLVEQHDFLWASVGIHPNSAETKFDAQKLRELGSHKKVVALGESGLDYFRSPNTIESQKTWLIEHILAARELKKPLIIHSREAAEDCLAILTEHSAKDIGGVFHCYAENAAFARRLAEINFLVSFPGIATFKAAENVREAIKEIPLEQIMLETDAPYLAPVPYRGKRCESAFMLETAKVIAQIKGISVEELAIKTSANAEKLFNFS
jgi:TatD DNase family protein